MHGRKVFRVVASLTLCATPVIAQIDPSGDWRTWRTEHFRVHAQAELVDAALEAAFEAERAYGLLAAELVPPRGIIDLVVAHNVDYSNGWATVFPSNRLSVYLAPPTGSPTLGYYDSWLRLVLIHELVHLFHLDRTKGVWQVLQAVFGRAPGLFPNVYQPSWVGEGMATYYESRLSTAGRARGTFQRGLLAASAESGAWLGQGDVWLISSDWSAGHRPYAWGTEFLTAQVDAYGDSLLRGLVEGTSGQLWPFAVSRPLRNAGGESVDAGWRRLRERVKPNNTAAAERCCIVERGLRVSPRPRVSTDGRQLAYVRSTGRAEAHVVVRSLDTGEQIASKRVNGSADLAWARDALYVVQLEFTSPVEYVGDLYRWLPGESWNRLTHGARLGHPFAIYGGRVGAVDKGARAERLVEYRDDGLHVLQTPPGDAWARVTAAPDQRLLAGARHLDGRWDIVVWHPDSSGMERLITDDAAFDREPVWSSDGRALFFTSERDGLSQIYAYSFDSGGIARLTEEPAGAMEPAPVPGGPLYYVTLLHDGYALVELKGPQTQTPAEVTQAPVAFEPAQEVATEAGPFNPWPALRPHYWIPFWHDEGNTGFFVSALTTGEDPIGRTFYFAATGTTFDPFRWEGMVGVVHRRWKRFQVEVSASQQWDGIQAISGDNTPILLGERERSADVGLEWKWRRFRSSASVRASSGIEHQAYYDELDGGRYTGSSPSYLVVTARGRFAHVSRPGLSISHENGFVLDGFYKRRWGVSDPGWSDRVQGRVSGYFALPLPGFAHWVLAAEFSAGLTGGPNAERLEVGGESGDLLETIPGLAFGVGRRSFAMRGYPRGGTFTRVVTGVVELRVPAALVSRGWKRMPVFLDKLSVTGYGEIGGGWVEGEDPDPVALRDIGVEAVLDLGLIQDYPLRVRAGAAVPLADGLGARQGDVRWYVALGSAF